MTVLHADLAAGRWKTLSFVERMANLGSEVTRALNWKDKARADLAASATDRALELFDLTLAAEQGECRLREIARTREVFAGEMIGPATPGLPDALRRYFLQFAFAARRNR